MSRSVSVRLLLTCAVIAVMFSGCSRDPNVRKQKYFDSGEKYFAAGKYREAAIQYSNAVQIDPRFAHAHSQLAQAYLKLGDTNRAFQELTRTVELAPDDYRARTDIANLLVARRRTRSSRQRLISTFSVKSCPTPLKPTRHGPITTLRKATSRQPCRR
jgi:Tfp pilus assembly protein PilF